MKYLLDTHTAIWAISDKDKLSSKVKSITDDTTVELCVSIMSAWEIAIKVSINKLEFEGGVSKFLSLMQKNGIELISVEGSHVECVEKLPFIHNDPFDRIIIATAKINDITILTSDKEVQKYDVKWLW